MSLSHVRKSVRSISIYWNGFRFLFDQMRHNTKLALFNSQCNIEYNYLLYVESQRTIYKNFTPNIIHLHPKKELKVNETRLFTKREKRNCADKKRIANT